jgi:predicted nucleotidyltransferase
VATPAEGLARLRAAAESGELDAFCRRHRVRVLTVFGSAARGEPTARDLDVAVLFEPGTDPDVLMVIHDLGVLTGSGDMIDFVHLDRGGPEIRQSALVDSVPLYESEPGALAEAQIAAVGERQDTDWMRRLDLELLAG